MINTLKLIFFKLLALFGKNYAVENSTVTAYFDLIAVDQTNSFDKM